MDYILVIDMLCGLVFAAKLTHDEKLLAQWLRSSAATEPTRIANIQASHAYLSFLRVQPEFSNHAFDQHHRLAAKTAQRRVRPNSDLREGSYASQVESRL
ncbi:MAG: hypothetical protein WA294_19790 [Acidobacteriaceae bacterium]